MKILFYTVFHPSVGGMEAMAELLADEWSKAGIDVVVVTRVQAKDNSPCRQFAYPVVRNPRPSELLRLTRESDVFLQNGISLRGIWPLLLTRKPLVVRHGTWYQRSTKDTWAFVKRWVTHFAVNVAISEAVARSIPAPSTLIYNPYDARVFHHHDGVKRNKELAFVGRLVSDKGVDVLLQALARLRNRDVKLTLTVIGDGPEQAGLESRAAKLNLMSHTNFVGNKNPVEISRLLCEHRILVVPSRLNETYGNVAVEGIACGCMVIGASVGGLPEAIGNCGLIFENGNALELAEKIELAMTDNGVGEQLLAKAPAHLEHRQPRQVAMRYLEVMKDAMERFKKR